MKRNALMTALILLCHALLLTAMPAHGGAQKLPAGDVETVLALPSGDSPEGIAIDRRGNIYVGNRHIDAELGLVSEILKIDRDGSVSVFATLPATANLFANGVLGLATDPRGNVYAALDTLDATSGVWRIARDGSAPERLAGSDAMVFPNALTFDPRGNLYVTDSAVGAIWRFGRDGSSEKWVEDDALLSPFDLDPLGFPLPGANGIAFFPPNHLYIANTEKGLIARVNIRPDGRADTPQLLAASALLVTADGVAVDVHGDVHVVIPGFAILGSFPLVKVDSLTGAVTPTVTDAVEIAKFDVPLSVTFGGGRRNRKSVFVTNGDLPIVPGGPGPGVVEVGVGVPGFKGR